MKKQNNKKRIDKDNLSFKGVKIGYFCEEVGEEKHFNFEIISGSLKCESCKNISKEGDRVMPIFHFDNQKPEEYVCIRCRGLLIK